MMKLFRKRKEKLFHSSRFFLAYLFSMLKLWGEAKPIFPVDRSAIPSFSSLSPKATAFGEREEKKFPPGAERETPISSSLSPSATGKRGVFLFDLVNQRRVHLLCRSFCQPFLPCWQRRKRRYEPIIDSFLGYIIFRT